MPLRLEQIERELVIVKPRQPFLDWLKQVSRFKDMTLERLHESNLALLIPAFEHPWDSDTHLEGLSLELFEQQLGTWVEDQSLWPMIRDLSTFAEWFDLEHYDTLWDTCKGKIRKESD